MSKQTITEFSISDHGVDNCQYFQGGGVAFTPFEHCVIGTGYDLAGAMDDALETMAQRPECDGVDFAEFETRLKAQEYGNAESWPASECVPDDSEDLYYYVTIKYNAQEAAA